MTAEHSSRFATAFHWLWRQIGAVIVLVLIIAAFFVGYAMHGGGGDNTQANATSPTGIWYCPMHPHIRQGTPGKCPICRMPLEPMPANLAAAGATSATLTVSDEAAALMDLETAPVERRYVDATVRMVGKVDYDETRVNSITAWVGGRIDRLYVDYTGIAVKQGDHLAEFYSPELLSAQEELLAAMRAAAEVKGSESSLARQSAEAMLRAVREKLRLWGLKPEQIEEIEARGTANDHVTINSPISGIVIDKNARKGMYVQTGDRIYTVADLSHVWIILDAYESDLLWLHYGQPVEFTAEALPGEVFEGRVAFINPVLDNVRRTVQVRVNVANEDGRLKPGMFVRAVVRSQIAAGNKVMNAELVGKWISPMHPEIIKEKPGKCDICGMALVKAESLGYVAASDVDTARPLVVPASAVLITGKRAVVYVKDAEAKKPTFVGREVLLGPRAGDHYIVIAGLKDGDLIVTRGAFTIDSAMQLSARPSMMNPTGAPGSGVTPVMGHEGHTHPPVKPDAPPNQPQHDAHDHVEPKS